MATIRVQWQFPTVLSNTGADVVQNTWHALVVGATDPEDAAGDFANALGQFYIDISALMTEQALAESASWKVYNLSDPEPRSPISEDSMTLAFGTSQALPLQCAVTLSLRSVYESGQPKARRRGRIYLGGFSEALTTSDGFIDPSAAGIISTAADDLLSTSDDSTTFTWSIWSPTDATSRHVTGGWVDNVVDVQRRRQPDFTDRSEFGVGH